MINIEPNKKSSVKFKELLFRFFFILIDKNYVSLTTQMILSILQCIQIISFSFDSKFSSYWNNTQFIIKIESFLKYFLVLPFFSGNKVRYSIGLILCCLIIITYVILSIVVSISLGSMSKSKMALITIFLQNTFHFVLYLFFIPMFDIFMSIFNCDKGNNKYAPDLSCSEVMYYIYIGVSIVFMSLLLLYCTFGYLLFFDYVYNKNNIFSKQTSTPDFLLYIIKIILVFLKELWNDELIFIVLYLVFTLLLTWEYWKESIYYNEKMAKINLCFSFIIGWNAICLFLSKLLEDYFNKGFYLFLIGIPFLVATVLTFDYSSFHFLQRNFKLTDPKEGYIYISKLVDLSQAVLNNDRKARIILQSYIYTYELHCTEKNCPLKKYNDSINQGNFKTHAYVLLHLNSRYLTLLNNCPTNAFIKIMYAYFLFTYLNHYNASKFYVLQAQEENKSLIEEFLLFRMNYILERSNSANLDDGMQLSYSNLLKEFKNQILHILSLYMSFWSCLFISHHNNKEDLSKLNDCGTEIMKIQKKIEEIYHEVLKVKHNDIQTIKYYADFLSEVVNDSEKAEKYYDKIKEIRAEQFIDFDKNLSELDIKNLNNDEIQYVLVSASALTFGCIMDISLGICVETGYTKEELIGKNLNILIPELMRNPHQEVLRNKLDEFKNIEIEDRTQKAVQYKTFTSYFVNKAHFIVPASFSNAIITNEADEIFFIAKISLINKSQLNAPIAAKTCYVITNLGFSIQNYSSEGIKLLALSNKELANESNLYLGNYIKDFKLRGYDRKINVDFTIRWIKKTNQTNINHDFVCNHSLCVMNNRVIGHIFKFCLIEDMKIIKDTKMKLDQQYIPEISKSTMFVFNTEKNSYSIKGEEENTTEKIKEKAIAILNKGNKEQHSNVEETEEEEDEDSYTHSSNSSESDDKSAEYYKGKVDSSFETANKKQTNQETAKEPNSNQKLEGCYLVKTSKIKFKMYNYQSNRLDDIEDREYFMCEIQRKMERFKEPTMIKKQSVKAAKITDNKQISDYLEKEKKEHQTKIMKQIEFSLTKNEAGPEMLRLQITSFCILLALVAEGVCSYLFYTNIYNTLSEKCSLIQNSYLLLLSDAYLVYYIREMTLLSMNEYEVNYLDPNIYREDTVNSLKNLCLTAQSYTDYILSTSSKLSKENEEKLYKQKLGSFLILDNLDTQESNITINAILSQTISSVFVLMNMDKSDLKPSIRSVYFSFYNSMNGLYKGLLIQADIFNEELYISNDSNIKICLIELIAIIIVAIITYFALSTAFFAVDFKKETYLSVFYEIDVELIRISLDKCENFKQKLLTVDNTKMISCSIGSDDNNDDSELSIDMVYQKKNDLIKDDSYHSNKQKFHHQKNYGIKAMLVAALGFSSFLTGILYILVKENCNFFEENIDLFKVSSELNIRYIMLFNCMREYFFDKVMLVNYTDLTEYINDELSHIYEISIETNRKIQDNRDYMGKKFKKFYDKIYYQDVCGYADTFFNEFLTEKWRTCEHVTNDSGQFGLSVLLTFFVEEIKEVKTLFELAEMKANERGYQYNMTLYGLPEYEELNATIPPEEQELYMQYSPVKFFNLESHDNLVIILKYILKPIFDEMNETLIQIGEDQKKFVTIINNCIIIGYFIVIAFVYFVVWKQIEYKVYSTIYKAKSLLMILPKEILVGLDSVQKLFELNVSTNSNEEQTEEE